MKHGAIEHVCLYYDMLSSDNQLRFFDFLVGLSQGQTIARLAEGVGLPLPNVVHEATGRMMRVLTFFSFERPAPDAATLSRASSRATRRPTRCTSSSR